MDKQLFSLCDEKCLRDEPAACAAGCPLHVDVASLGAAIAKRDFQGAYKVLEKRLPLAGILGMICDHPCEKSCVVTEPLHIGEMEKAAVMYGRPKQKKLLPPQKKPGTVAIIGGGISGLSAGLYLARKGYQVAVYEQTERIGGRIWDFAGSKISPALIEDELQIVDRLGIRVLYGKKVRPAALAALLGEYDAIYLGTGRWEEALAIDAQTFAVSAPTLFAGGRLLGDTSLIGAASSGKRAAISIERSLQKISLTASREREGAFISPFAYDAGNTPPSAAIEPVGEYYSREEAAKEAARCLNCQCGDCVKGCAHLRKFNMAPKAYARQILINDDVILGTRYANTMINSCALCGLCGEACPLGINMGDMIREARLSMVAANKMPPRAHDFALRDMEFCAGAHFYMAKNSPDAKNPDAKNSAAPAGYVFYPGCQLPASCPEHVEQAYAYLRGHIKEGVGLMLGCCGAPADWAARGDLAEKNCEGIRKAWQDMGQPCFILACTSCMTVFDKYLPEIAYISLWELMRDYGLPENLGRQAANHTLHIHDACGARHNGPVQESVREIVRKLGYSIEELENSGAKTKCCGYGGLVFYANREQADAFAADRAGDAAGDMVVYCAMCKDLLVNQGKRAFHILDLVFAPNPEEYALRKMPGLSQRRANRAALKNRLLRELWQEDKGAAPTPGAGLIIPPAIRESMEQRLILLEDIEDVLANARLTGQSFYNPDKNIWLAGLRKKNVTYWVQWAEKEDGTHIISTYSHRMEVLSE